MFWLSLVDSLQYLIHSFIKKYIVATTHFPFPKEKFRSLCCLSFLSTWTSWQTFIKFGVRFVIFRRHPRAVAYRGGGRGGWVVQTTKFRKPSKILPNSTRLWKLLKIAEFMTPTPQDVREKRGSKILKLPPVRNCFTLAMTSKLVVNINSLKVPKIKKILLYEKKFMYQITAASRTPDWGAAAPRPPLCL